MYDNMYEFTLSELARLNRENRHFLDGSFSLTNILRESIQIDRISTSRKTKKEIALYSRELLIDSLSFHAEMIEKDLKVATRFYIDNEDREVVKALVNAIKEALYMLSDKNSNSLF